MPSLNSNISLKFEPEYQQFDAEARYALQKQEVLVLEHLQQLLQHNSPYLSDIDHSLLSDWLYYQLMQHEIHPVISEWLEVETDMPRRSRQDAMQDPRLYKRFNPNTDEISTSCHSKHSFGMPSTHLQIY